MKQRTVARYVLLILAAAAAGLPGVRGLSWPLCESGGQVWVTERPRTEPTFPGANLWYFCEGGLNVLGVSIDPCLSNGTNCTPAVYDALCQAFGFDMAGTEERGGMPPVLTKAKPGEAVWALTGEYCLRAGVYSKTVPQDLESMPGAPCTKVDGLSCIRHAPCVEAWTRETIISALDAANLAAFKPAPPTAEPAVPADMVVSQADQQKAAQVAASQGGGARKLLRL